MYSERQKAERLVKQLKRKVEATSSDDEDTEELKKKLHVAEVDLAYTKYFPFLEPYISIYPKKGPKADETTPTAKAALDAERPPMWKEVETALEEGDRALEKLRDRNPDGGAIASTTDLDSSRSFTSSSKSKKVETASKKKKKKSKYDEMEVEESEGESGSDGFFEQ